MRLEREYVDAHGNRFIAVVDIDDAGDLLERAVARLANKARGSAKQRTTAFDGVVRVAVRQVK